ncbi:hypothetical protein TOPH_09027 [Tolypocladium ophioglossoides CBS 100239]|uniref:CFEM domain-containing protein n=1 Tax=Tolypocladium ophioglossoides (strain CBS 100239) TaxID=1163406 RepID=A0A0L0MWQ9_TOLOC|nr:hypothetical protein TOPH_09027 [Tolypocladium ophioglossoides CBS 100239]
MKPIALAAALFALAASAIDLATLQKEFPKCSLVCLVEGVHSNGCDIADFACQCSKLETIIKTVAPCLVKAGCDLENIIATARVVLNVCENDVPDNVTIQEASTTSAAAGAKHTSAATAVAQGGGWAGVAAMALAAVML